MILLLTVLRLAPYPFYLLYKFGYSAGDQMFFGTPEEEQTREKHTEKEQTKQECTEKEQTEEEQTLRSDSELDGTEDKSDDDGLEEENDEDRQEPEEGEMSDINSASRGDLVEDDRKLRSRRKIQRDDSSCDTSDDSDSQGEPPRKKRRA